MVAYRMGSTSSAAVSGGDSAMQGFHEGRGQLSVFAALGAMRQFSTIADMLLSVRPGTKGAAIRKTLEGTSGHEVTLFAPTNSAFEKMARKRQTTVIALRASMDVGELIAGHIVEGRWPVEALRMAHFLPTIRRDPLAGPKARVQAVFSADFSGRGVRVALGGAESVWTVVGEPANVVCSNGFLHGVARVLSPIDGWIPATTSAEDQSRREASERRDWAQQRSAHRGVLEGAGGSVHEHASRSGQSPTKEDVEEECARLRQEERQLQAENKACRARIKQVDLLATEFEDVSCRVLSVAGVALDSRPRTVFLEVRVKSVKELRTLQDHLSERFEVVGEKGICLDGRQVPVGSELLRPPKGICAGEILAALKPALPKGIRLTFRVPHPFPGSVPVRVDSGPPLRSYIYTLGEVRAMVGLLNVEASLLAAEQGRLLARALAPGGSLGEAVTVLFQRLYRRPGTDAARLAAVVKELGKVTQISLGIEDAWAFARLCNDRGLVLYDVKADVVGAKTNGTSAAGSDASLVPQCTNIVKEVRPSSAESKSSSSCDPCQQQLDTFGGYITIGGLTEVLSRPGLPGKDVDIQTACGHLKGMRSQLEGHGAGSLEQVHSQTTQVGEQLASLQSEVAVLRAQMPHSWDPPLTQWEEVVGASPPKGASWAEMRAMVVSKLKEAQGFGARAKEVSVAKVIDAQDRVEKLLLEAAAKASETRLLYSAVHVMQVELQHRTQRTAVLRLERRRVKGVESRLVALCGADARKRVQTLQIQHAAIKIQRSFRDHLVFSRHRLNAILFLQMRIRLWRKRREKAAHKIQRAWRCFQSSRHGVSARSLAFAPTSSKLHCLATSQYRVRSTPIIIQPMSTSRVSRRLPQSQLLV